MRGFFSAVNLCLKLVRSAAKERPAERPKALLALPCRQIRGQKVRHRAGVSHPLHCDFHDKCSGHSWYETLDLNFFSFANAH